MFLFLGLHFTFGLGSIVTPLVVTPFLSNDTESDESSTESFLSSTIATTVESASESRIHIPYGFGGLTIGLSGVLVIILYFYKKYEPPKSHQENIAAALVQNAKEEKIGPWRKFTNSVRTQLYPSHYAFSLILMAAIFMAVFLGMEWAMFQYFPSFAVFSKCHVSKKEAAYISTGLSLAFTLGRIAGQN